MQGAQSPHYDKVLVHYAEIGLKGGNRPMFETRLRKNLDGALRGLDVRPMKREQARYAARLGAGVDIEEVLDRLTRVPGVAWCAPAVEVEPDIDAITAAVMTFAAPHGDTTFRIDTRRSDKQFPMDSLAVNRHAGAAVVSAMGRSVSLANAQYRYRVQIDRSHSNVYWDRREGPGGLPVGTQGTVVALMSGGIDSPVAAWRMMVRGCRVHLVHFLNRSVSTNRVVKKIEALADRLSLFHGPIALSIVPFEELQREIVMVVQDRFRMIVYRRMMFRIAEKIRSEIGALGFVTGDSVGQVASQTLENLRCIYDAAEWPVYSPLSGLSKREITEAAKKIGTYETSIIPHDDCCSFMIAKHPATRADLEKVRAMETFDVEGGIAAALEDMETKRFGGRKKPPKEAHR